jgi:hypothetical protein
MALYVEDVTGADLEYDVTGYEDPYHIVSQYFYGILEGGVLEDLYLPLENASFTLRGSYTSTPNSLRMSVPAVAVTVADLSDRSAQDLVLYRVRTTSDGVKHTPEEIIRTNFDSFEWYAGSVHTTYQLSGSRTATYTLELVWNLDKVVKMLGNFEDAGARKEFVVGIDALVGIKPQHIVNFGGKSLQVDYLTVQLSASEASVFLVEAGD